MKILAAGSCALLLASVAHAQTLNPTASCENLSSLALTNAAVTLAQTVPAGQFTLPTAGAALARRFGNLPGFCRVAATLKPSPDCDIKIEVWLPSSGWNDI